MPFKKATAKIEKALKPTIDKEWSNRKLSDQYYDLQAKIAAYSKPFMYKKGAAYGDQKERFLYHGYSTDRQEYLADVNKRLREMLGDKKVEEVEVYRMKKGLESKSHTLFKKIKLETTAYEKLQLEKAKTESIKYIKKTDFGYALSIFENLESFTLSGVDKNLLLEVKVEKLKIKQLKHYYEKVFKNSGKRKLFIKGRKGANVIMGVDKGGQVILGYYALSSKRKAMPNYLTSATQKPIQRGPLEKMDLERATNTRVEFRKSKP